MPTIPMIPLPLLIALGPCLMMAMAALALTVINVGLSRSGHALLWAAGFAAGAAQWAVMALRGAVGGAPLGGGLIGNLLSAASILLVAEGFRRRRHARRGRAAIALLGGGAAVALALAALMPVLPIRAAINPALTAVLLAWAATTVVRPGTPPSLTEVTVAAVLLAVALVNAAGAVLAAGEQFGTVADHRAYVAIYVTASEPAAAGVALATLMLIAFDYAVELRRMLHTDPLTGILNREGFLALAQAACERARTRRLALAIVDVDRFKQVNDRHGHAAGDAALAGVAEHLAAHLGRDGQVARIGGEEFAILLPGSDAARALVQVERLRRALHDLRVDAYPALAVTASFGVAERRPGEDLAGLMERADAALYRSKRDGRDRATLAAA